MEQLIALVRAAPASAIIRISLTAELEAQLPHGVSEQTTFGADVLHAVLGRHVERVVFERNGEVVCQVPTTAPNRGVVR